MDCSSLQAAYDTAAAQTATLLALRDASNAYATAAMAISSAANIAAANAQEDVDENQETLDTLQSQLVMENCPGWGGA